MKRTIILVFSLTIGWLSAKTQETVSVEKPYFFDEFKRGTVFFSNNEAATAMLNYNFVSQQVQFLDHQNDNQILDLVRQPNLTHIKIENTTFVPVDRVGFAAVIQDGPVTLLHRKRVFVERDKTGGYGIPNSAAAVDNLESLGTETTDRGGLRLFNEFPIATKTRVENHFYLMKNNRVHGATRRNYIRLYSEVRPQLERFINEHSVDFRNEQHLRGLSKFANGLLLAE